jgi:hypothetical protein
MLLCPISRSDLLVMMPRDGAVVEIGVAEGDFSAEILARNSPKTLHLIDPWVFQPDESYRKDLNNTAQSEQDRRWRSVNKRFSGCKAVEIHRGVSTDVVGRFDDRSLDWIYIDGNHTRDAVESDLRAYAPKVADGGFILGHDYTNHQAAEKMGFGVVEAVNNFAMSEGWDLLAMTMESYPTYVLARDKDSPSARWLTGTLLYNVPFVVDIRDFPRGREYQNRNYRIGDKIVSVPSF